MDDQDTEYRYGDNLGHRLVRFSKEVTNVLHRDAQIVVIRWSFITFILLIGDPSLLSTITKWFS